MNTISTNDKTLAQLIEKTVSSNLKESMIIRDEIRSGGYSLSYEVKIETGIHLAPVDNTFRNKLYETVWLYRDQKTSSKMAHKLFEWVFRFFYGMKSERHFEIKVSIDDHVFTELKYE